LKLYGRSGLAADRPVKADAQSETETKYPYLARILANHLRDWKSEAADQVGLSDTR